MELLKENINPEPMNADDLQMLRMIDSYSEQRKQDQSIALQLCGIESQRLQMYAVGAVCLTAAESEMMASALFS